MSFLSFKLNDQFVNQYKTLDPGFGFNGLGYVTYMRTYSRIKDDGTNEQWFETVRRVVEGCYSMQKDHINSHSLPWKEYKAQRSAEEMYDHIFNMRMLPPGRGLWVMGSEGLHAREGRMAALFNCAFVSTGRMSESLEDATKPFLFLMDNSMLGVGVGFDVLGAKNAPITINKPTTETYTYQIPDTREGWVESLKLLLESYFNQSFTGHPQKTVVFDYSLIRAAGEPIRGFGGKASGPAPLISLHEVIKQRFDPCDGKPISVTNIADVMNLVGKCVVAGNVRRSAEIMIGEATDNEYMKLKDYRWNPETMQSEGSNAERADWGWMSNNSVLVNETTDYDVIGKQIEQNGEPGCIDMGLMRSHGRLIDPRNDKDHRAVGTNPCCEQTLESYELCNLVELFPTRCKSKDEFLRVVKFAYLYAKTITLSKTAWKESNEIMLRNRRIGTSMTGITQFVSSHGIEALKVWCNEGYKTIQEYDQIYSEWMVIPRSIKTTSVKPSGTISLLAGVTPGVHFPESNYYIRRMRLAKNHELVQVLKDHGYTVEEAIGDPYTMVAEFPVYVKARTLNEVSIWEQMALACLMQEYWADNQVSCTVTFKKEDGHQIPQVLKMFHGKYKGISFLPKLEGGAYPQMPYEEVSKEKYEELYAKVKPIGAVTMSTEAVGEAYCTTDSCEIKTLKLNDRG